MSPLDCADRITLPLRRDLTTLQRLSTMKRRQRVTYGSGPLSRPSMPTIPGWPSRNNLKKWSKARRAAEDQGIKLLIEHYANKGRSLNDFQAIRSLLERRSIVATSIESEAEQLRSLVLALATDHVPFFAPKKRKRATIDSYVLAQLLNSYQKELERGQGAAKARRKAADKMHSKLRQASDRGIQNLLARARSTFRALITANPDGSITPAGALEARIWQRLTDRASSNRLEKAVIEPCLDDPDSIVVKGI